MSGPGFDNGSLAELDGQRTGHRGTVVSNIKSAMGSVTLVIHDRQNIKSLGQVNAIIRMANGSTKEITAYPMSPHSFTCPLPNEKIHVIQDPETTDWFYTGLCSNGWRINHLVNANVSQLLDDGKTPYAGEHFSPDNNRSRAMEVYEGDVIMQSRSGASLRFSHTNSAFPTPWNTNIANDDTPVICLRTGLLGTESIITDHASIYLTSDQQIEIPLKAKLSQDVKQDDYDNSQIILYSDRLVLGSRSDDILLSSNKTIQLCTQKYQHDVDKVLDLMGEMLAELKKLTKEVKNQAQYSMTQTFPVPSLGTSLPSTMATNYGRSFNSGMQIEQTIMQIEQKFDMLKQK